MGADDELPVHSACRHALKPIVRFLLRNGMTFKGFSEVARSVFVEVASTDYGIAGRRTNAARVAILTGLTRREVKRQRDLLRTATTPAPGRESLATRVLSGWFQDPEFTDAEGQPRLLAMTGEKPSFTGLLARYSGDVPPTAMLKELKTVGCVEETDDGRLRALSRSYIPVRLDAASVRQWSVALHDLCHTINHNTDTRRTSAPRFERMAINALADARSAEAFRQLVAKHGQALLERVDSWLSQHEAGAEANQEHDTRRLGVGIYFIEDEQESMT